MDPAAGRNSAGAFAVAVPVESSAAGAAAPPAGAAAAAARPAAWTQVTRVTVTWAGASGAGGASHVTWAAALLLMGCAAAGLALFALSAADSSLLELGACAHADQVAALRTASQRLLLAASAQVPAATMGVLVPARPVAFFAYFVGWLTAGPATDVLWMLVACHDSTAHDEFSFYYRLFRFLLCAALAVGTFVSVW
ncbi:uncharacterized protein [Miscanthus floridulus]|uniref:uncharacterized protein isoform X2 n=1 Tax=Miscanthus floridulus TaxID=154761 RepID=UPI00345B195E